MLPTLTFRQGNAGTVALRISRGNAAVLPTDQVPIHIELRLKDDGFAIVSAPLTRPSDQDTVLTASLPASIKPGPYLAALRFDDTPVYRTPLAQVHILPVGSLDTIDLQGLNVVIDESSSVIAAQLDASPVAALVSFFVQQALSSQLISKKSFAVVDTKQELLALPNLAGTMREVFVKADESRGNGPTTYNVLPNGDRYLTSFLIVKDN